MRIAQMTCSALPKPPIVALVAQNPIFLAVDVLRTAPQARGFQANNYFFDSYQRLSIKR